MFLDQITIEDETHETVYALIQDQLLIRFAPDLLTDEMNQIIQDVGAAPIEHDSDLAAIADIQFANDSLVESKLLWVALVDPNRSQQQYLEALGAYAPRIRSASPVYQPESQGLRLAAAVLLDEVVIEVQGDDPSAVLDSLDSLDKLSFDEEVGVLLAPFYSFHVNYDPGDPQQSYGILEQVREVNGVGDAEHGWMQLAGFYDLTPNDPEYNNPAVRQYYWGLREIDVEAGWDIWAAQGGRKTEVAIIDGGFEVHDDIEYHRDTPPAMFGGSPQNRKHGTNVAGVVAAKANNARGTAGIGFDCLVHPVRLLQHTPSHVALRIRQAVDLGPSVINMSFGFSDLPSVHIVTIRGALEYAHQNQVVLVAAAGNLNLGFADYPARDPLVIGVGAVKSTLLRRDNSNYNIGLDVVAPGDECRTTDINDGYDQFGATSCAAPHVAGLAALIRAARPGFSADTVRAVIESTCSRIREGSPYRYDRVVPGTAFGDLRWDPFVGLGLINCAAAMKKARDLVAVPSLDKIPEVDSGPHISPGDEPGQHYCGYPGQSAVEDQLRIYCNLDLSEWIEIPKDGILGMYPMDLTKPTTSLSMMTVSVRSGTKVMRQRR